MGTGRSTETSRELAEERVVRTFLERAASVILESRTLDGERFDAVVALAKEVGLTREQLSCELRFLELRGVITSAPWDRLDLPDDVPRSRAALVASDPDSALARPPAAVATPPLPPAAPEVLARFREVVEQRLTRYGTLTTKARQTIEADGAGLGLAPDQIAATLSAITAHQLPTDLPADAGAAVDIGLPSRPSPVESFRRWVKQKLAGYASVVLAVDDEQGLIGVGAHRYHLADILAMDVVRDVATQRDMRLERDLDGASCHSTVGGSSQLSAEDQELPEFDTNDPRQLERREAFRSYLRRTLAQLPHGIVTFRTHRRLVEAGSLFHGVAPQWIKPTIHEVASEMGSRFTSEEQAVERVSSLVEQLISRDTAIDGVSRAHIYAEGTRWGLDPMDVEAILRNRIEQCRQLAARQQQRIRRGIIAVGSALICICVAWLWLYLARRPANSELDDADAPETVEQPASATAPRAGTPWWDEHLSRAVADASAAHPDLAVALAQARTADAVARGEAYALVIDLCVRPQDAYRDYPDIQSLLGRWYAAEPSDVAAWQIPQLLLAPASSLDTPSLGEGLPLGAGPRARAAFWGCRTAARLWKAPDVPAPRSADLAALLESVIQEPLDHSLEATQLENQCVAALARRCYAALPYLASEDATQAEQLYRAVAAETAGRVHETTLDRLDADFLAAAVPAVGQRWEDYRDVLRRTAHSQDVAVVQKLLEILRQAPDPNLRQALAGFFCERLAIAPGSVTETELIEAVRTSIEVTSKETNLQRWDRLASQTDAVLHSADDPHAQPVSRLQETLDCTYFATLACALTQGEEAAATFQELESQSAARRVIDGSERPPGPIGPFVRPYPVSAALVIRQHIDSLVEAREVEGRLALLRLVANASDTLLDIDPSSGQKLAAYLFQPKGEEEHRQLLSDVARLARWNAVRLGLCDQLAGTSEGSVHRQEVLRSVLGQDVSLRTSEDRQRAGRQLLETVWAGLAETAESGDPHLRALDQGSRALRDLYRIQARLLRVPAETFASAPYASAALRAMITHLARQLDPSQMSAEQQQFLEAWPRQLVAADFVADDDLEYTAMLQRIWLHVLGMYVAQRVPAQAAAADEIVAQTLASQAARDRALDQLHDLEAGLLRLWMLCRPDGNAVNPGDKDV